jgi:replicative DNA helicase
MPETPRSIVLDSDVEVSAPDFRMLPHNLEAEQALLGAILVNNDALGKVQDFLAAHHFFEPVHGRIFEHAAKLIDRGQLATPVTLKPYFEHDEALADVGGAAYLARLSGSAVTIISAEDYGRTIYDLALRRDLITIGEEMVLTAYDSPIDAPASTQIEGAEQRLFELAEMGGEDSGFKTFATSVRTAVGVIEKAFKRDGKLSGVTTGFKAVNEKLGGLHPSDLVILAGRPAMGKTALATNIGFNAAIAYQRTLDDGLDPAQSEGAVVGFFSLEMSAEQLATRILSERAGIPSEDLRRGKLKRDQFRDLARVSAELERLPFYIDDTPQLSIAALRTRARRLKRQYNLGLVIVDYLQLLRGSGSGGRGPENRVQEISEITRGLKGLAKELNIPVIALSQLSRVVEQREDKRPQLSDLRESGSIEQDADMVTFVFREEYYHQMKEPTMGTPEHETWQAKGEQLHGLAEFIIGKQRHGPTGTVRLFFDRQTTRFTDLADDAYMPEEM